MGGGPKHSPREFLGATDQNLQIAARKLKRTRGTDCLEENGLVQGRVWAASHDFVGLHPIVKLPSVKTRSILWPMGLGERDQGQGSLQLCCLYLWCSCPASGLLMCQVCPLSEPTSGHAPCPRGKSNPAAGGFGTRPPSGGLGDKCHHFITSLAPEQKGPVVPDREGKVRWILAGSLASRRHSTATLCL